MMKDPFGGILLNIAFRMLVPFTLVYAVYVLVLGETSPGGGFQAGVVMGFGIVLARLILGERATIFNIQIMPVHMEPAHEMHALGILMIEIGVTICVMMTILNIMDAVVERSDDDGRAE